MECISQKVRSFQVWWQDLSCFGQKLPVILASLLFLTLVIHILFEVSGTFCEAISIKCEGHRAIMECGRDSFWKILLKIVKKTTETIVSDGVRNLGLLLAASIGWFFLYWRARSADQDSKTAKKSLTSEQFTRAIEQLTHEKLSIRLGSILGLEQIAITHEEEHGTIIKILVAHIHELAKLDNGTKPDYWRRMPEVKSVIGTLANIAKPLGNKKRSFCIFDGVSLRMFSFKKIDLSYFSLVNTNLTGSKFEKVDFSYMKLSGSVINDITFKDCKGLTKKQIMTANWHENHPPRGLPEEWNLPPENIIKNQGIEQEKMLIRERYLP